MELLAQEGVDSVAVEYGGLPTGHAIIQVDRHGENNILVYGGANQDIPARSLERACDSLDVRDSVLLQNETNATALVLQMLREEEIKITLNPSPMTASLLEFPLDRVDTFIINRTEGEVLSGECEPGRILDCLTRRYHRADIVLTLGQRGVLFARQDLRLEVPAEPSDVVDTTGAGDTFAGYFLAEMCASGEPRKALQLACKAAAHCVSRPGASPSIPRRSDLGLNTD